MRDRNLTRGFLYTLNFSSLLPNTTEMFRKSVCRNPKQKEDYEVLEDTTSPRESVSRTPSRLLRVNSDILGTEHPEQPTCPAQGIPGFRDERANPSEKCAARTPFRMPCENSSILGNERPAQYAPPEHGPLGYTDERGIPSGECAARTPSRMPGENSIILGNVPLAQPTTKQGVLNFTDDRGENVKKQLLYTDDHSNPEKMRRVICSNQQAFCVTGVVLISVLIIAMVAIFARPMPLCPTAPPPQYIYVTPPHVPRDEIDERFPWKDIRLPSFIIPLHYDIYMNPNLTNFYSDGHVTITFKVNETKNFIVLHSKDLNIRRNITREKNRNTLQVIQYLEYPKYDQIYIAFDRYLEAFKEYELFINFEKSLEEKLEGLYISSYNTSDGQKRNLTVTHFEPTAARSAFPCFDEPAMKATFTLRITHNDSNTAYFNTAVDNTDPYQHAPHTQITTFKTTPKMSTYLVAFVVCDFEAEVGEIELKEDKKFQVRILVPQDHKEQAQFALQTTSHMLKFFETFFAVSYPLKKLDAVAIPDFGPGAMENWGLMTFRMSSILYKEGETSSESKEHIATVIAHEVAHQWLGDLVTMRWWDDLWLNEGFASYLQYRGVDDMEKKWKMMDQFIISTTQDALALDSLESSHPIVAHISDPAEIQGVFDAISYKKGAAILYMLENFLGMDKLKKGLTSYLNKYKFSNATTEDLWTVFAEVATEKHLDVSAIMNTWTRQKGYPLITVSYSHPRVTLTQKRFLLTPPNNDDARHSDYSPYGYTWYVPVTYKTSTSGSKEDMIWLNRTGGEFNISSDSKWLKLNNGQTGFYRVMYDGGLWQILVDLLLQNHAVFKPADRANLLDDALTLSRAGILDSATALNLTMYLKNEKDYLPWQTAISHFEVLDILLQETQESLLFERYMLKLLDHVVKYVGWEDQTDAEEDHLKKKLRSAVLLTSIKFHHSETKNEAKSKFDIWKEDTSKKIHPDLRNVVYTAGVKYGGEEEWTFCWAEYQKTQVPSEKRLLLSALGHTQNPWRLSQYLSYSLDKTKIRPQDAILVISVAARNPVGRLMTWRFVRMNWSKLLKIFGQGAFSLGMIISETVSHFSTQFDHDEVKNFFSGVEVGSGKQSFQQSLERIQANIHWREKTEASVIHWLKKSEEIKVENGEEIKGEKGDENSEKDGDN